MTPAKARIVNYNRNCSFIVLATVITIVNYDCHLFIVQVTALILNAHHLISDSNGFKNNPNAQLEVKKNRFKMYRVNDIITLVYYSKNLVTFLLYYDRAFPSVLKYISIDLL